MATHLLCRIFGHKFSEWESVKGSCNVTRTCKRDGATETAIQHEYGAWQSDGPCNMTRTCKRDGATETTIQHEYGAWQSDGWDHFREIVEFRVCSRCGNREEQRRGKPYSEYTLAEAQDLSKAEYADYMEEKHGWSKPT
jgi:hypothetical protein